MRGEGMGGSEYCTGSLYSMENKAPKYTGSPGPTNSTETPNGDAISQRQIILLDPAFADLSEWEMVPQDESPQTTHPKATLLVWPPYYNWFLRIVKICKTHCKPFINSLNSL